MPDEPRDDTPESRPDTPAEREHLEYSGRSGVLYCGLCGALNPSSNHFCARCGTTLLDAFHATEGLRVFQRPDAAARIVDIVPAGSELEALPDADAPADYLRIKLADGRLGYVRTADLGNAPLTASATDGSGAAAPATPPPDINTAARGCITPAATLWAVALLFVLTALFYVLFARGREADQGIILGFFCVVVLPVIAILIGLYLSSRARDERDDDH